MKNMKLDDKMYIEHMIPHHQVAVDMSKRLLLYTKQYGEKFGSMLINDGQKFKMKEQKE